MYMKESIPAPPHNLWEGNSLTVQTSDDEHKNTFVSITGTGVAEPGKDTLEIVFGNLVDMAREVAAKMTDAGMAILDERLIATGNEISAKGEFQPTHILETFEKIEFNLNESGEIDFSGFGILAEERVKLAFYKTLKEVLRSEQYLPKLVEILESKKKLAHERENNRKLVR